MLGLDTGRRGKQSKDDIIYCHIPVNTREYLHKFPYCSKRGILQPQDRKKLPVPKKENLSLITKGKNTFSGKHPKIHCYERNFPVSESFGKKNTGSKIFFTVYSQLWMRSSQVV
jgi:hypothetical protein